MRPIILRAQAIAPDFGGIFFEIVGFYRPYLKRVSISPTSFLYPRRTSVYLLVSWSSIAFLVLMFLNLLRRSNAPSLDLSLRKELLIKIIVYVSSFLDSMTFIRKNTLICICSKALLLTSSINTRKTV